MCKNKSLKKLATRQVIQLRLQIQSGLRKQILFDPVDVTFSS